MTPYNVNMAEIVGPEDKERITIRNYFSQGLVFVLDSKMVRVSVCKAGDPVSIPTPGEIFFFWFSLVITCMPVHCITYTGFFI